MDNIYEVKIEENVTIITMLNAEVGLEQLEDIRKDLYRLIESDKHMLLNLSKIIFISSVFLMILISCLHKAKEKDKKILICNASPEVKRVLKITGIDKMIPVYKTEKKALKILS